MSMSTKQRNLIRQMEQAATTISRVGYAALAEVRSEREDVRLIEADWQYSPNQKHAGAETRRAKTSDRLADLRAEKIVAQREYDEAFDLLRSAPVEMGNFGAVERQMAWDRLKDQLDQLPEKAVKGLKAQELLERAEKVDDRATLAAAYQNLRSYLDARGDAAPDGLWPWLAIHGGTDAAREANEIDILNHRTMYRSTMAFDMLDRGHRERNFPDVVPASQDGKVVQVDPTVEFDSKALPGVELVEVAT